MLLSNGRADLSRRCADGLRVKEFVPYGRLAQSMAFFRAPGIDRLYSA